MRKFIDEIKSLQVGDRIVVPKSWMRWVQHHAIYLGYENGHHWFIENVIGIGVRTVTAEEFFEGVLEITRIERFKPKRNYGRDDLVRLALSKLGRNYKLFNYNCESFANHLQYRVVKSKQVETGIGIAVATLLVGIIAIPFMKR